MTNGEVNIKGVRFPLWGPVSKCLSVVVLVAACFLVYRQFIDPVVNPNSLPMPRSEISQLREMVHHVDEIACKEMNLDGIGMVKHYCSDNCALTYYEWRGKTYPKIVFHPERLAELTVQSAGLFGGDPECPKGRCLPPWEHPGEFSTEIYPDEKDPCIVWHWRRWPDKCLQYQRRDECESVWVDEEPQWECCAH